MHLPIIAKKKYHPTMPEPTDFNIRAFKMKFLPGKNLILNALMLKGISRL